MKRRKFTAAGLASAGLCLLAAPARAALSETDAAAGIRAALERGAAEAVNRLGRPDGFLGNPKVRIPLPKFVADAAKLLRGTGQQQRIDELMTAMNRAAERAVPHARPMLISAVKSMSLSDARRILSGDDDSATQFFVSKTRRPLIAKFLPIVTEATQKVSLADKYNAVAGRAHELGLIKQEDADIQHYVTGKALDGLYYMIGEEERRIRKNPAATGSAILKKVFGSLK